MRVVHDRESAIEGEVLQLDKFHAEASIGFVATIQAHGIGPSHAGEGLSEVDVLDIFENMLNKSFEHLKHVFLLNERHLAVNLCELGLTVGAEVFVAETFDNLEITVEPADHKKLLECLRRLRKSVELTGVHARRHNEVASTFGGGLDEYGSLNFEEALGVEVTANLESHAVAQFKIAPDARTSQVEVPVFHTEVVATVGLVLDGERRNLTLVQYLEGRSDNLDIACGHVGIFIVTLLDGACDLNHKFASELICRIAKGSILLGVEN